MSVRRLIAREWLVFAVCCLLTIAFLPVLIAVSRLAMREPPSPLAVAMQDVLDDPDFYRLPPQDRGVVFGRIAAARDPKFKELAGNDIADAIRWSTESTAVKIVRRTYVDLYSTGSYWLIVAPWAMIQLGRSTFWAWRTSRR